MESDKSYVLITPAKNEALFISKTINSVVSQTVRPLRWIIVSDGSTDGTDEIVRQHAQNHSFIDLVQLKHQRARDFASKADAVRVGYERIRGLHYDYVGNLDADVSFDADYYENLIREFIRDPSLGIAGGLIEELYGSEIRRQWTSANSVAGASQMFRRECYEKVGGYLALRDGGEDGVAGIAARMYGWNVRTFRQYTVVHHKGSVEKGQSWISDRIRLGRSFYQIGYHPLFELARCIMRIIERPYVAGSILEFIGYCYAALFGYKINVPSDVVRYLRGEQMKRLGRFASSKELGKEGRA